MKKSWLVVLAIIISVTSIAEAENPFHSATLKVTSAKVNKRRDGTCNLRIGIKTNDSNNLYWQPKTVPPSIKFSENKALFCKLGAYADVNAENVSVGIASSIPENTVMVYVSANDLYSPDVCLPIFDTAVVLVPTEKDAEVWKSLLSNAQSGKTVYPLFKE